MCIVHVTIATGIAGFILVSVIATARSRRFNARLMQHALALIVGAETLDHTVCPAQVFNYLTYRISVEISTRRRVKVREYQSREVLFKMLLRCVFGHLLVVNHCKRCTSFF